MENEKLPDLNQIHLIESVFVECLIANGQLIPISPTQIGGFNVQETRLFPLVHLESRKVSFDIRVRAAALDTDSKPLSATGSFRIILSFQVGNLFELLYFDEHFKQQLPTPTLTASLIGVAYSTARGMIMSKVSDTILSGLTLPLRSVQQIMQESQPSMEEVEANRAEIAKLRQQAETPTPLKTTSRSAARAKRK